MILPAIRIPPDQPRLWLEAVGDLRGVRAVELPAALLETAAEPVPPLLRRLGLSVLHADGLLPSGFLAHFTAATPPVRERLVLDLRRALAACGAAGVRNLTLDLELQEPAQGSLQADAAPLVRQILATMMEQGMTFCLPLRLPLSWPGSREWQAAANLAAEVLHPACAYALTLELGDLPADFPFESHIRELGFHLQILRLAYTPALGETPTTAQVTEWHRILQRQGFKGVVVFCPRLSSVDGIRDACLRLDALIAEAGLAPADAKTE